MPNIVSTTAYGWVVSDLKDVASDLQSIQSYLDENISEVEAALAHYYLKQVVQALILATRIGRREWSSLSQQMQSLTTSASPTETSIDSPSPQTNVA